MEDNNCDEGSVEGTAGHLVSRIRGSHSGPFAQEIQQMMHGFGDVAKPLLESAQLIEKIVHQQIVALVDAAVSVAYQRGSKYVGLEEFLFLLRRDKGKLHRLLQYLKHKDLKTLASKEADEGGPSDALEEAKDGKWKSGKRMKLSRQFLAAIDSSGELTSLVDLPGMDSVKQERLLQDDIASRKMDMAQYMHFIHAKHTNFGRNAARMREWLAEGLSNEELSDMPKLNQMALEVVAYIAYEAVAQIVDLARLVKQDRRLDTDPIARIVPQHCAGWVAPAASGHAAAAAAAQLAADHHDVAVAPCGSGSPAGSSSSSGIASIAAATVANNRRMRLNETEMAIQPVEIREAMRRHAHIMTPFAALMRPGSGLTFPRTNFLFT